MAWEHTGGASVFGADVVVDPAVHWLGTRNGAPLIIRTQNGPGAPNPFAEVMRFTAAAPNGAMGHAVGIGTTAPQRTLHVVGGIYASGPAAELSFDSRPPRPLGGLAERWVWYASNGQARLWSGTDKLLVTPAGEVGIGTPQPRRTLHVHGTGIHTSGGEAELSFASRTEAAFVRDPTRGERWVWWASGVQTAEGPRSPANLWSGRTFVWVWPPNGDVHVRGKLSEGSDAQAKTNIQQLRRTLDKLSAIRGVSFDLPPPSKELAQITRRQRGIGVLAQEVEEVFPELVATVDDPEEYKVVNYSGLTAALIEAVKELKAENESLRSRITALEQA